MRQLATVILAVIAVLVPAAAASAAPKKPAPARWAKRHHLKGHWRARDADRDGLSNLREFKLNTDPRRADSDRDGLKDADELRAGDDPLVPDTDGDGVRDGAEHAGVVTAFDGTTLTLRQFHGPAITAPVDADVDCYMADDIDGDSATDDSPDAGDDVDFIDDPSVDDEDPTADDSSAEDVIDLTGDDDSSDEADDSEPTCADAGVTPGAVVAHLELDRDDAGDLVVYEIELAG